MVADRLEILSFAGLSKEQIDRRESTGWKAHSKKTLPSLLDNIASESVSGNFVEIFNN